MPHPEQAEIDQIANEIIQLRKKAEHCDSKIFHRVLQEKQEAFISRFKYLVINRTAKYRKFSNYKDLEQDGFEALFLALRTYDPSKGSFTWWADKYISTRVARAANTHSTIRVPLKKARTMKPYKTATIPILVDSQLDPQSSFEVVETNQQVLRAVQELPEQHQNLINLIYGFKGQKPHSVGNALEVLSISRSQCLKMLKEAEGQLRERLDSSLIK